MQETRRARLEAVILDEMAQAVRGLKDPRVPSLTFTRVQVTPDGGQATVWFILMGAMAKTMDEAEEKRHQKQVKECLEGLQSASGFLRRHLASTLTVRHVPTLVFKEDRGLENSTRVHELLKQIGSPKAEDSGDSDEAKKEAK